MTPVIDFHTHILPGMDDGAQSVEMAVEMLTMLRAQGVTMVFATSHYTPIGKAWNPLSRGGKRHTRA